MLCGWLTLCHAKDTGIRQRRSRSYVAFTTDARRNPAREPSPSETTEVGAQAVDRREVVRIRGWRCAAASAMWCRGQGNVVLADADSLRGRADGRILVMQTTRLMTCGGQMQCRSGGCLQVENRPEVVLMPGSVPAGPLLGTRWIRTPT